MTMPVSAADAAAVEALVRQSAGAYASGDWEAARRHASEAVAQDDKSSQARLQLAMALMKLERWAEAEAESDRAIALGYGRAAVYNVRSVARLKQGKFDGALADAERAVSQNPGGPIGYVNRAAAKAGLKKPGEEIVHDYQRASEVDARYVGLYESAKRKYSPPAAPPQPKPVPVAPKVVEAPAPEPAPAAEPEPPVVAQEQPAARDWLTISGSLAGGLAALFVLWLLRSGWKSHRGLKVRFGSLITAPPPQIELAPGSVVAGLYIVGRLLEKNGPLELYEARDLDDAPRLLKRLVPKPELGELPYQLARKAAALRHPAIETVESVFQEGPRVCLACVPAPGETLERARGRLPEGRWTPEQALRPFQTACEALAEAHRQGVVHGAITSRAIVIERGKAALTGFGLAAGGEPEDDVRALAACFAEAVSGRNAEDAASALGPGLGAVFTRALSKGFRSADELFQAYRTVVVPLVQ